ncbi:MAG: protein kinase [Gemmatimonadaceae bacterium]
MSTDPLSLPKRFELDREIGRGGMAVVYRAHDNHLGRFVAIKVLSSDLSSNLGAERFQREIALMAKLVHPGIVALFDSGESDGRLYYVMPLVVGETLRARLTRERRVSAHDVAALGADIAEALAYAHGAGIVHRDVKPENIFAVGGRAVLADFGIARIVDERSLNGLTTSGMVLGTVAYMSPEQAGGESNIDGRSDLYSLGCVLYELVTGVPPFVANTAMALIGKHMIEQPIAPSARGASVHAELDRIILQLLAKRPAERPASAADAAILLRAASHFASPVTATAARATNTSVGQPGAIAANLRDSQIRSSERVRVAPIEYAADVECAPLAGTLHDAITSSLCVLPHLRMQSVATADDHAAGNNSGAITVSGTARRSGDRVRVSLRVVEHDGELTWSQNVDGAMSDPFALEDAVAQSVFRHFTERATRPSLPISRTSRLTPDSSSVIGISEADQLVVDGLRAFNKFGPTGGAAAKSHMDESMAYFTRALALDPHNARGLCALGNWYSVAAVTGIAPRDEALQKGRDLIFSALAADDQCAEVHCSLSKMTLYHDDDFHAAARHIRRAIELDPHEPEALRLFSIINKILGRPDEAVRAAREATERAPDNAPLWNAYADSLMAAGRNSEAVDALKRAIGLLPGYGPALERLELAHTRLGNTDLAIEIRISRFRLAGQTARAIKLEEELKSMAAADVMRADVRRELAHLLADANTTDPFLHHVRRTVADRIVSTHAELGEWKEAMDWVEKAYERRPGRLRRMLADMPVDYRGLAVDPRYARLMRVAGMEDIM